MIQAFPPQVAKLIPRLASAHDGEVIATARAIDRLLRRAGLDWHRLAEAVVVPDLMPVVDDFGAASSEPTTSTPSRPAPPASPSKPREPGWSDLRRSEQLAWCAVILAMPDLDDKTVRLVNDVRTKLHVGQNFHLAPRHKRTLTGLVRAAKVQGLAA